MASEAPSTNAYLDNNFAAAFPGGVGMAEQEVAEHPIRLRLLGAAYARAFIPNALGLAAPLTMNVMGPTNGNSY